MASVASSSSRFSNLLPAEQTLDDVLLLKTELYLSQDQHSEAELAAIEALFVDLIPRVSSQVAIVVAERLARRFDCPQTVVETFIHRKDRSSEVALRLSLRLSDAIFTSVLETGGPLRESLARRIDLTREGVLSLLETQEPAVLEALALNHAISFDHEAMERLMIVAQADFGLARLMLARPAMPASDQASLFLHATPVERRKIVQLLEPLAKLDPVLPGLRLKADFADTLERAALSRQGEAFATLLAEASALPKARVMAFAADATGEPIATLLRFLDVEEVRMIRIFLFLDPRIGHSYQAMLSLIGYFQALSRPVAARLVALMGGQGLAPIAGQEPRADASTLWPRKVMTESRKAQRPSFSSVLRRQTGGNP